MSDLVFRAFARIVVLGWFATGMWAAPAHAVAVTGACCLPNLSCTQVFDFDCAAQGGQFIGMQVPCEDVTCTAPMAAPVLSILGVVGMVGALSGVGVYRLFKKRRR